VRKITLLATGGDPVKVLYWSAVINGVTAVPLMIVMMPMGSPRRKVMGEFTTPWPLKLFGWLATAAMATAAAVMFVPWAT